MATRSANDIDGDPRSEAPANGKQLGNESYVEPPKPTRAERMAEAQAKAEARKGTLIEYIPPMDMSIPLESVKQLSLDQMVIPSPFSNHIKESQIPDAIKQEFNKLTTEDHKVIVEAGMTRSGDRLDPGYYLLCHRNKIAQMEVGRGQRLTVKITGGYTETAHIGGGDGRFKQTDPLVGGFGSFILNIPQGKVGRIWLGNVPKLYGEGFHVVHSPDFREAREGGNWLTSIADSQITHGNLHILRVPAGSLAKVTVDTHQALLPYRKEPYCFDTPFFEYMGLVTEDTAVIEHGPLHLIRVPAGSVGTAWIGSRPILLEYREEPYYFDDPLFRFEARSSTATGGARFGKFHDAQEKFIRHGAINRLRPGVRGDLEVAVVQCDGNLEFIEHATMMDNANWAVLGFLNMGLRTHIFPSQKSRDERRRENPRATADEVNFEPMTTRDSLKVGLKLLVAFQVSDPHALMRCLRLGDVTDHVENLAVSDMARAVQNSTSQNFLNSSHHDHKQHDRNMTTDDQSDVGLESASEMGVPKGPTATMSIADKVKAQLSEHLNDCGLKLVRFNVEEAKVLDEELAKEMSKQALVAATASAQQSIIEQKAAVAQANAELEAMARRVKQDQENQIKISAAKADLEAQKLVAQGVLVKAEAERKARDLQGEMYQQFPELLQLELMKVQMAALNSSSVTFVGSDLGQTPFGAANGFQVAGMPQPKK